MPHLAKDYALFLHYAYEGTLLAAQEIHGKLLAVREEALWTKGLLDQYRFCKPTLLSRIVIGIDPALTTNLTSDETGMW